MNRFLQYIFTAVAALLMTAPVRAAEVDAATQGIFKTLMTAAVNNDHEGFVSLCDDTMKAAMTKPLLEMVSTELAPRTKDGYDADYLGELSKQGFAVHLWRLRFKSGGDDVLATMSVKDGKVGGFYLK